MLESALWKLSPIGMCSIMAVSNCCRFSSALPLMARKMSDRRVVSSTAMAYCNASGKSVRDHAATAPETALARVLPSLILNAARRAP